MLQTVKSGLYNVGAGVANTLLVAPASGLYNASAGVANALLVAPANKLISNTLFASSSDILINVKQILEKLSKNAERDDQATRDLLHTILQAPEQRARIEADLKKCTKTEYKTPAEIAEILRLLDAIDTITSANTANPIHGGSIAALKGHLTPCLEKLNKNLAFNQGAIGQALAEAEERLGRLITTASTDFKETLRGHPEKVVELRLLLEKLAKPETRDDQATRDRLAVILTHPERFELETALNLCPDTTCKGEIANLLAAADQVNAISSVNTGVPIDALNILTLEGHLTTTLELLNRNMRYNIGLAGQHLVQAEERIRAAVDDVVQKAITSTSTTVNTVLRAHPDKVVELKKILEELKDPAKWNDVALRARLEALLTTELVALTADLRLCTDLSCIPEIDHATSGILALAGTINAIVKAPHVPTTAASIKTRLDPCLQLLKKNMHSNQGTAGKYIEDIVANALAQVTQEVNSVLRARPERLIEIQDLLGKLKDPATCTQVNRDRFNVIIMTERALVEDALKLCEDPASKTPAAINDLLAALTQVNVITGTTTGIVLTALQVTAVTAHIELALQKLNSNLRTNQGTAGKLLVQAEERIESMVTRVIEKAMSDVTDVLRSYPAELVELKQVLALLEDPATRDNRANREKLNALLTTPASRDAIIAALKTCSKVEYHPEIHTILVFLGLINAITIVNPDQPITNINGLNYHLEACSKLLNKNLRYNQGNAGQLIEEAVERALTQASAELKAVFKPCPEKLTLLKQTLEALAKEETFNDVAIRTQLQTLITTERHLVEEALRQTSDPSCKKVGEIGLIMQFLVLLNNITAADLTADINDWQLGNIQYLVNQCLPKLNKNLRSNQGVVSQLLTQVEERVETIANRVIEQMDKKADDILRGYPEQLVELRDVLEKIVNPATRSDASNRAKLTALLTTHRPQVMVALQKCTSDICKAEIAALMTNLDQICATIAVPIAPMFVAAFEGALLTTLTQLKKNLQYNQGTMQAAAGAIMTEFKQTAQETIDSGLVKLDHTINTGITKFTAAATAITAPFAATADQITQLTATVNLLTQRMGLAAPVAAVGAPAIAAPAVLAPGAAAPASWVSWTWISSLLSQVSQKLGGAVSDATFNTTLSFIAYTLRNADNLFETNAQTGPIHAQIKSVVAAIESVLAAAPGPDQAYKWTHTKNALDTLIGQINGARIYLNGMTGIPAFPSPFGNHPHILNIMKQILDLLADPVHQHDQTTRNLLTEKLTINRDELVWALNNCSDPVCKAEVGVIMQHLAFIYNITAYNVAAPIAAVSLPDLAFHVNKCREKLNKNLESNYLKDASQTNTVAPIDAFAASNLAWRPQPTAKAERTAEVIKTSIEGQICTLAANSSEFAYVKFINESVCGGKLHIDYFSMIQEAKRIAPHDQSQQTESLRVALFEKIDQADVWFFTKWTAKLTYYVMKPLTDHLIGDFSKKLTSNLWLTLNDFEADNFTHAQNQIVEGLSGYFSALSSAYDRVAAKTVITGTLDQELLRELQNPALNGNYATPHDLYNKVVHKALNEFNPKAGWTEWVYHSLGLSQDETHPDAVTNPFAKVALNFVAGIASFVLFIPEKIIDFTIYRTLKSVIVKNQILDKVLNESLSSLETPSGHTHAVNVIILNLLKKVWEQLLQEDSNGTAQVHPSDTSHVAVSDERKQKLRGLIESLFQVLAKSQHTTPESLRDFVSSGSVMSAFRRNVDGLVGNNVVEPTIDILTQTFQEIMKKEQWLEMAEQALQSINESFENPENVTPAVMAATQDEIAEYLRRVLHKAVGKAVDQKIDIDKKIQEREMDKCLHQIKGSTAQFRDLIFGSFTNGQKAHIGQMTQPIVLEVAAAYGQPQHDHATAWFSAVEAASLGGYQFAAIDQATANFLNERLSEHTKNVYNNPLLDQKSKNELAAYYSELIQKFNATGPYKLYLDLAKGKHVELYDWIKKYQAFSPAVGAGHMIQDLILEPTQTLEVIDQARFALPTIQAGLNQQGIAFDMPALHYQLDRMHAIRKDHLSVVDDVSALYEDFIQEKENLLANKYFGLLNIFSSLQEKRDKLEARIYDLLPDSLGALAIYQRGRLLDEINAIATATEPHIVTNLALINRQLFANYKTNWTLAFNQIHELAKVQIAELSRRMQVRVLEQRTLIKRMKGERDVLLGFAKEQLQLICVDIDKFEKKPIVDVQLMQNLVRPLLSGIKSVTVNLVQEKAEGCIRLVRNPANYRYGLFHRLVFLPYVGEAAPV